MSKISIVMPVYNAEKYVSEAIESVLQQSFEDFEFIIVDDGSTDKTLSIIHSYKDKRINLIQNSHNFINSLNIGLNAATSKYIARMDADDRMHIDRLKIQYNRLEESPQITVCGSWMVSFGEHIPLGGLVRSVPGFIEYPLLHLLRDNVFFHPTIMLRTDFLRQHKLQYNEKYIYAEDYKLWFEIAKCRGLFYIETQALLYYRYSDSQVSLKKEEEQKKVFKQVRKEILDYLIALNQKQYPSLSDMNRATSNARQEHLLDEADIFNFFYALFMNNKQILEIGRSNELQTI